jgi:head-tail adaptor
MRSRMTLEYRGRLSDGAGGWTEAWATYAVRWVKYTPLSRQERMVAMGEDLQVSGTVALRYEPGMPSPLRFVDDARILEQVGGRTRVDDRNAWYEVDVKEVQDDVIPEIEFES